MSVDVVLLDPVDEHVKEVYARYGLAMYYVQCVERQLAIAMATVYGPGTSQITGAQYEELLENLFQRTFGGLITKLRNDVPVPADFEARLEDARRRRNFLAHHYFWERAGHFTTEAGRRAMIEELTEHQEFLAALDAQIYDLTLEWGQRHGVTEEMIAHEMERLTQEAQAGNS